MPAMSRDPKYLSAKASIWYWRQQHKKGTPPSVCEERIEWWTGILETFRALHAVERPLPDPRRIATAKMPKISKQVVKDEREVWVPEALSWN
jgi:hypothetical protein